LQSFLAEVEKFAVGEYWSALTKGDRLTPKERQTVIAKLQRFTGLSPEYLDLRNLRINIHGFCKELLRDKRRTVGRIDSRFTGIDDNAVAENPEHDPSISSLMPPYTSAFMQYVRQELEYKTDLEYQIFGGIKSPWSWGSAAEGMPDTSEALRKAMSKNPHMKVFIASGYFDLATPYFATEYTLGHMGLDPSLRSNVETQYYDAGHMMYIHEPALGRLKNDIGSFLARSSGIASEPKKRRRKA
jgi:carboxypeptidase C (cathepsin A)